MSILGKVLVVLVTLLLLVWIYFAAMVAERNANWGKKIQELEKSVSDVQAQIPDVIADINRLRSEAIVEQVRAEKLRETFRAELAAVQRLESQSKEELVRLQLEVASVEAQVESATARVQSRTQEKNDLLKERRMEEGRVAELKDENTRLRGELKGMQDQFLGTMDDNRKMAQKLLNRPSTANAPRTRLGSLIAR